MTSPPTKTTRIMQKSPGGTWTDIYWDESRREWRQGKGTCYKSIEHARSAIKKFNLKNCSVIC